MTVYLVISLLKISYIKRIYGSNQPYSSLVPPLSTATAKATSTTAGRGSLDAYGCVQTQISL